MENFEEKYRMKNPYTVPDGYFEGLTDRIMQQVQQEKGWRRRGYLRLVRKTGAWAAAVAGLALVVRLGFSGLSGDGAALVAAGGVGTEGMREVAEPDFNPTSEEIIEYLADEADSYDLILAGIYGQEQ